jgi:hypothetical protein
MNRWRDLMLAAYAPLALRHALVEGRWPGWPARRQPTPRIAAPKPAAHVVRLFAVQIR